MGTIYWVFISLHFLLCYVNMIISKSFYQNCVLPRAERILKVFENAGHSCLLIFNIAEKVTGIN